MRRAPLPTARQEIGCAVVGGKIYVIGGLDEASRGTTFVEVYDPASNSWSSGAPLPEALHHIGLAASGGRIYVVGGYTGNSFQPTNRVYEYFPVSNTWTQISSMPVARGALSLPSVRPLPPPRFLARSSPAPSKPELPAPALTRPPPQRDFDELLVQILQPAGQGT